MKRLFSTRIYSPQVLNAVCSCGKCGFTASSSPVISYYNHSKTLRDITNDSVNILCDFKPSQVEYGEANVSDRIGNEVHHFCSCSKKEHLGIDQIHTAGVISVNVKRNKDQIPNIYKPNVHIYYDQRVQDYTDSLTKWKGLHDGEVYPNLKSVPENDIVNANHPIDWNGHLRKDVLPLSTGKLEPGVYSHTENDPPINNVTSVPYEQVQQRVSRKYDASAGVYVAPSKKKYEVIIIGGGHNGLVTSAYLGKNNVKTLVLERRHIVGGAAVTEELIPGFKFSRGSYLAGLLRPQIISDLKLEKYGFKYLPRNPSSFTPTHMNNPIYKGRYLLLGDDEKLNHQSIAQFSVKDADAFPRYEEFLGKIRDIVQPLLDNPLPSLDPFGSPNPGSELMANARTISQMIRLGYQNREIMVPFYELFTGPAQQILDRWFESEILKTTLATDAVIGAAISPKNNGSAYVLLHHVMGEAAGKKGVWSYVEGGMGAVSNAIAESAKEHGAEIVCNAAVREILYRPSGGKFEAYGVRMEDGSEILADTVITGCSPYHTFMELLPGFCSSSDLKHGQYAEYMGTFNKHIKFTEFGCGAFKINCAVDRLPNFMCYPSPKDGSPGPMHKGTVHFECFMEDLDNGYREASMGMPASRPVIEMTVPSAVDTTIAPPGKHVVMLFVQYAPYEVDPKIGSWADPAFKNAFADRVFRVVEEFCPGFINSVIGRDILSPLDLERVFGMHKGNIHHGSLALHQLAYTRPMSGFAHHRTPLKGLYMCSSGTHPGGGVMGAPGKNCAEIYLRDRR